MKKNIGRSILFVFLFVLTSAFILTGIVMGWFVTKDTVIPPTCTDQGYTLRSGLFNRKSELNFVAPLGHRYTGDITEPTCLVGGYTAFTCSDCGHSYDGDFTDPLGHQYRDTVQAPGCSTNGYTTHTCVSCQHTYTDSETQPTGHTYAENVTVPTCTDDGYTTYTCTVCADVYQDNTVPALGHTNKTEVIVATCTEPGYTLTVCEVCAMAQVIDPEQAKGHEYLPYIVHPTCTTPGYTTYMCSRCRDSYTADQSDARGHNYVQSVVTATKTAAGGTLHTCSRCNDTHMTDVYTFAEVFHGRQGDGQGILYEGVDLSHHNGTVDFEAMKNAGISFVILRLGTSRTPDTMFETYYKQAKAAGLHVGAYLYTYADSTDAALADVAWVVEQLEGKTFEYPIFYDIEDSSLTDLSQATLTDITLTFCDAMVEAGYYPGVYTNKRWMADHLDIDRIRTTYDIWLASWIVTGENIDDYSDDYSMWQYTATGSVAGVNTDVDRNGVYRDYPTYIRKYGYNGF